MEKAKFSPEQELDEEGILGSKPKKSKEVPFPFLTDSSGNVIPIRSRKEAASASEAIREGQDKE